MVIFQVLKVEWRIRLCKGGWQICECSQSEHGGRHSEEVHGSDRLYQTAGKRGGDWMELEEMRLQKEEEERQAGAGAAARYYTRRGLSGR